MMHCRPDLTRLLQEHAGVILSNAAVFFSFFLLIWFTTSELGIGSTPDSASYLSTAKNLREHLEYRDCYGEATPHFPPLYPALLATTSVVTFRNVIHGASRLLAAASFAFLGTLTYQSLRGAGASEVMARLGGLGLLAQPDLVHFGSCAMTEIPFLALTVAGGIGLVSWSRSGGRRFSLLLLAGICFSLACMTRYVGVVWPAASLPFLLVKQGEERVRTRLVRATIFGFVAYAPLFIWFAAWRACGTSPGGRLIAWHPIRFEKVEGGLVTLGGVLGFPNALLGAAILVALVLITVPPMFRRSTNGIANPDDANLLNSGFSVPGLVAFFALCYIGFLVLSISYIDRATPLDGRMLTPFSWAIVFLLVFYAAFLTRLRAVLQRAVAVFLFLALLSQFLYRVVPSIAEWHAHGLDLAHRSIRYDRTLALLREHDFKGRTIYSNVPWIVYLTTWRESRPLPSRVDYTSGLTNDCYETDVRRCLQAASAGTAVIVMDSAYSDPNFLPPSVADIARSGLSRWSHESTNRFVIFGLPVISSTRTTQKLPW